jgi:hypothetical protein
MPCNIRHPFEQVVLKNFNFPSIEDFEHNTTVTEELPELRLTNYRHYDVWIYLGVLPGKGELATPSTLFYNVSFTSSFCIRWKRNLRIWKNECQVTCRKSGETNKFSSRSSRGCSTPTNTSTASVTTSPSSLATSKTYSRTCRKCFPSRYVSSCSRVTSSSAL